MAKKNTSKDGEKTAIGFVSSIMGLPANENRFSFIIYKNDNSEDRALLTQFDIVKVKRSATQNEDDYVYGVVEQVQSICDAPDHMANFISSNFGQQSEEQSGGIDRIRFYLVSAKTIYNEKSIFFPVRTGDKVYLCEKEDIHKVLYVKDNSKDVFFHIASFEMYRGCSQSKPLLADLNRNYLLGPDGAHLNISGMSGVASKTTKAMTVLWSLFNNYKDVSVVIFNTKDKDLLNIANPSGKDKSKYKDILNNINNTWGVKSIDVFEPRMDDNNDSNKYCLDFTTQKNNKNLDLLTAMDTDESGTMDSCINCIQTNNTINGWDQLNSIEDDLQKKGVQKVSVQKFLRLKERVFSKNKSIFQNEEESAQADITTRVKENLNKHRITVVDLAPLDPLQQAFVFGSVIRQIKEHCADQNNKNKKKVAVFIDELNKYASFDTPPNAPILKNLIDIAETGRSIGLCLVTAEQSLSIIHKRIKANFSNQIFGRTGVVELTQPDYLMIPESYKQRLSYFQHKDGLISSACLNSNLLLAEFPDKFYADSSKKTDGGTNQKEESKAPKGKSTSKKKS